MRRWLSLAEIVRRVVERTRLVEFALTRPDGEQGAANLLAIVDEARLFAAAGGGGLQAVHPPSARLDARARQIEIEATVAEETDDVVRIMTVHGAKGLEYPDRRARQPRHASPAPTRSRSRARQESFLHFRVGAGSAGRHGHFTTPGYDDAWEEEKEHIEAERLRLLYVAATRARDHLIDPVRRRARSNATGLLGALVHALPLEDRELVDGRRRVDELERAGGRARRSIRR